MSKKSVHSNKHIVFIFGIFFLLIFFPLRASAASLQEKIIEVEKMAGELQSISINTGNEKEIKHFQRLVDDTLSLLIDISGGARQTGNGRYAAKAAEITNQVSHALMKLAQAAMESRSDDLFNSLTANINQALQILSNAEKTSRYLDDSELALTTVNVVGGIMTIIRKIALFAGHTGNGDLVFAALAANNKAYDILRQSAAQAKEAGNLTLAGASAVLVNKNDATMKDAYLAVNGPDNQRLTNELIEQFDQNLQILLLGADLSKNMNNIELGRTILNGIEVMKQQLKDIKNRSQTMIATTQNAATVTFWKDILGRIEELENLNNEIIGIARLSDTKTEEKSKSKTPFTTQDGFKDKERFLDDTRVASPI